MTELLYAGPGSKVYIGNGNSSGFNLLTNGSFSSYTSLVSQGYSFQILPSNSGTLTEVTDGMLILALGNGHWKFSTAQDYNSTLYIYIAVPTVQVIFTDASAFPKNKDGTPRDLDPSWELSVQNHYAINGVPRFKMINSNTLADIIAVKEAEFISSLFAYDHSILPVMGLETNVREGYFYLTSSHSTSGITAPNGFWQGRAISYIKSGYVFYRLRVTLNSNVDMRSGTLRISIPGVYGHPTESSYSINPGGFSFYNYQYDIAINLTSSEHLFPDSYFCEVYNESKVSNFTYTDIIYRNKITVSFAPNGYSLNGYKYIVVGVLGLSTDGFTFEVLSSSSNLTVENGSAVVTSSGASGGIFKLFTINVSGTLASGLEADCAIYYYGNLVANVKVLITTLDGLPDFSTDTVNDIKASSAYYKYWTGVGVLTVSAIDTNEGIVVDPSSLLLKSSTNNIYHTIELKDGTLFLGNYSTSDVSLAVHEILNSYNIQGSDSGTHKTTECTYYEPTLLHNGSSTQINNYIPDLTIDSQRKRLFKNGEEYSLGLVFVTNTGQVSNVYYIDKSWRPLSNPTYEAASSSLTIRTTKPCLVFLLNKGVCKELASIGVAAVIPVCAKKTNHNILCSGYISSTVKAASGAPGPSAIDSWYSWFYRDDFLEAFTTIGIKFNPDGEPPFLFFKGSNSATSSDLNSLEFQNYIWNKANANSSPPIWELTSSICSLNTPEVEIDEALSDPLLSECSFRYLGVYSSPLYKNNMTLQVSNSYTYSKFDSNTVLAYTSGRFRSGYIWGGLANGYLNDGEGHYTRGYGDEADILSKVSETRNYRKMLVNPWQRNIIGGEGASSEILSKILLNYVYYPCTLFTSAASAEYSNISARIYRDFDVNSIIAIDGSNYQGNLDYIWSGYSYRQVHYGSEYLVGADQELGVVNTGLADTNPAYAGYSYDGTISSPILIRYKSAPHIAIKFGSTFAPTYDGLHYGELYRPLSTPTTIDEYKLEQFTWIKCGDLRRINADEHLIVIFEEGDYFFGRYDSLRTYPYAALDPNSVIDIVSGMCCSRVNLDSRCDNYRGTTLTTVNPTNFNVFNSVYNQANDFFTYTYLRDNVNYKRNYKNTILFSLTKNFGSEIDTWCNIQEANFLDLDGDKGYISAIKRLNNTLFVFLESGIALIAFNDRTALSVEEGVPIEILNSNKVTGKYYIHDNVGCRYLESIARSPNGLYFVDNINKSIYMLSEDGKLTDICLGRMKSWANNNLSSKYLTYYDKNSLEVLFTQEQLECILYSDIELKFNCFASYENCIFPFNLNDFTILIYPKNISFILESISNDASLMPIAPPYSPEFVPPTQPVETNTSEVDPSPSPVSPSPSIIVTIVDTLWKRNSKESSNFFGSIRPLILEIIGNPEPSEDKTFANIEYRMDCFYEGTYLPNETFNSIRVYNEYQDTDNISLWYVNALNVSYTNYNPRSSILKKFRIWRTDIPRVYNTMQRIRNPWAKIRLELKPSGLQIDKVQFYDLMVSYYK